MALPVGHKKYGGRVKGTLNKRTEDFKRVLERHNFCAATALLDIYKRALNMSEALGASDEGKHLKIAGDMVKEIASYSFPKLKAIEQVKNSPLDGMSPEQKLEALESLKEVIKSQIIKDGP